MEWLWYDGDSVGCLYLTLCICYILYISVACIILYLFVSNLSPTKGRASLASMTSSTRRFTSSLSSSEPRLRMASWTLEQNDLRRQCAANTNPNRIRILINEFPYEFNKNKKWNGKRWQRFENRWHPTLLLTSWGGARLEIQTQTTPYCCDRQLTVDHLV